MDTPHKNKTTKNRYANLYSTKNLGKIMEDRFTPQQFKTWVENNKELYDFYIVRSSIIPKYYDCIVMQKGVQIPTSYDNPIEIAHTIWLKRVLHVNRVGIIIHTKEKGKK